MLAARENRLAAAGVVIVVLTLATSLLLPVFYNVDPLAVHPDLSLASPSGAHVLGTDTFGRDLLARIAHAARLDFAIAFSVGGLALSVGSLLGALAGYAGGILDDVVMRLVDLMLSFPAF